MILVFVPLHSSSTTTSPYQLEEGIALMACLLLTSLSAPPSILFSLMRLPLWQLVIVVGQDGHPAPKLTDSLTARAAALSWRFSPGLCVCSQHVSSASWLFASTLSWAITGLFEMLNSVCISLFQSASGSIYLPLWWFCFCYFDAVFRLILSLSSLITAPDGVNLHHAHTHAYLLSILNCCFPLWHLWNQNTEVPRLIHT